MVLLLPVVEELPVSVGTTYELLPLNVGNGTLLVLLTEVAVEVGRRDDEFVNTAELVVKLVGAAVELGKNDEELV